MKYFLYSKNYVIIRTEAETTELEAGKISELKADSLVFVYPTEKNYLPFFFKTDKSVFKNEYLKKVEYPKFLMLEANPPANFSPVFLKGKNFKDYTICLIGKPYKLLIDHNLDHFVFDCKNDIKNIDFSEKNNLIFMNATLNDNDYTVVFHKKSGKFQEFIGNFTMSDNKITILKDKHTFFRHGELKTYEIQDNEIYLTLSEPVYLNGKPAQTAPFLNHIAFFQAVKEKYYNLAKMLLSEKFAQQVSPKTFEHFFGNFDEIKPIVDCGESKIALIKNLSKTHSTARIFKVQMLGPQIHDIFED